MTDTNQASKELREIFIDRMWNYFGIEDKSELAYFGTIYDQAVAPLIRTEKLKLLAEVRERVQVNQKGQFEEDSTGTVCWYLDDLVEALKEMEAEL